ncbi:MAG TPA: ADP-glyceromanno-heptose 6-epimerase [Acetobacteraceae bacterium]|nr:ADP-glyceromanno-heptose 6-epimerase [Acetobacteraceae bacterium]
MILVTGGAGFIGSNLHAALTGRGLETVVVDRLRSNGKWHNLAKHPPARIVQPDVLDEFLAHNPPIEMIFHLGAVSETTASDGDFVWETNVELPLRLWRWCAARGARLVYASSAATYGDGAVGFDDDPARLGALRPLNLYGWTKHAFDLRAHKMVASGGPHPAQWVGLKFFNVYGPNEYHKGPMISVVKVKHDEVAAGLAPSLFRSDRPDVADGAQRRDFVWVGDLVDVLLWLLDHPGVSGLYNIGTGQARSYLDLAHAVCDAMGAPRQVEFVPMPERLAGQYQSFTEARMDRLRAAGYQGRFLALEDGVQRYVKDYLQAADPYR